MKRYHRAALTAALLLAPGIWATSARAQEDGTPPPARSARDHRRRDEGGTADKLKEKLGLTDDQSAKLDKALKSHGAAMKVAGRQLRDGVQKLGDQLADKASDSELTATLDSLKAARKAMAEEKESFEKSLSGFLTPTQRATMIVGMAKRMRGRGEGWGGNEGGGKARGPQEADERAPDEPEDGGNDR